MYKVGDIARVKSWDELTLIGRPDEDGDIIMGIYIFADGMRKYCGKTCEIISVDAFGCYTVIMYGENRKNPFYFFDRCLSPVHTGDNLESNIY